MNLKRFAKFLATKLVREYELYWIFSGVSGRTIELPEPFTFTESPTSALVASSSDPAVASLSTYFGRDARVFAVLHDSDVVVACAYWWGERYARKRNLWALAKDEAKLVQIVTATSFRGKGLASALVSQSAIQMKNDGFNALYSRIWHSNIASVKAFEKAGWEAHAFIVRFQLPFGKRLRMSVPEILWRKLK